MGSPVKRVKQAIRVRSMKNDVVLSSVEGTLIWKSEHKYGDRQLVRLHITDAHPVDSFEELSENGEVIRITNSRKHLVRDGNKCELVARAADITTFMAPSS
ncbi:hypothetical protein ATCC90586_002567 [Pythium insidiosum]|nr:hypothetical protein ATCC90586_002567 [Pythium insidiosum]